MKTEVAALTPSLDVQAAVDVGVYAFSIFRDKAPALGPPPDVAGVVSNRLVVVVRALGGVVLLDGRHLDSVQGGLVLDHPGKP